jgi:hypothetical protein
MTGPVGARHDLPALILQYRLDRFGYRLLILDVQDPDRPGLFHRRTRRGTRRARRDHDAASARHDLRARGEQFLMAAVDQCDEAVVVFESKETGGPRDHAARLLQGALDEVSLVAANLPPEGELVPAPRRSELIGGRGRAGESTQQPATAGVQSRKHAGVL